ncbi:immunity protein [Pectobacterium brasiliense]|uniref:immunity protein n=1 Tax=Pectobacterium brasiliense TaxID=180957 RepID=UPI0025A1BD94|nr:immunity protein [Pectobacterium brasiliense]WJM80595.1 immunity protein [Pectobacterium brasiliense]
MKPRKATLVTLFILICSWFLLFFTMIFIASFCIAALFYFKDGDFLFTTEDVIYSLKMGASVGIPTGAGIWIMSRLKANKEK